MWAGSCCHTFLLLLLLQSAGQRTLVLAAHGAASSTCLAGLQLEARHGGAAWGKGGLELLQGVALERGMAAGVAEFGGCNARVGGGLGGQRDPGIKNGGTGRSGLLLPVCVEQVPAAGYGQLMLFFCATVSSMLVVIYYTAPAQLRMQISRHHPPRFRKAGRAGSPLIVWRSRHGSLRAQVRVVNGGTAGGGGGGWNGKWFFPRLLLSRLFAPSTSTASSVTGAASSSSSTCSGPSPSPSPGSGSGAGSDSPEAQDPGFKTGAQERPRPSSRNGRKGSWKGAGRGSDRQGRQASRSSSEAGGGGSPTPAPSSSGRQAGSGGGSVKQPKESFRKGGQPKRDFLAQTSAQEQQLVLGDAHKEKQRNPAQSRTLREASSLQVGTTSSPVSHKQESGSSVGAEPSTNPSTNRSRSCSSSSSSSSSSSRASKSDGSSSSSQSPKSSSSGEGWAEWEGWEKATVQGWATGWWNRSGIWGPQDRNSTSSATAAFGRAVAFGNQGHWTSPESSLWGDGHCSSQPWLLHDSLLTSLVDLGSSTRRLSKDSPESETAAGPAGDSNSSLIQDTSKLLLKCRARPSSMEVDTDWGSSSSRPSSPGCFSPFSSPRAVGSRRLVVGVIGQGLGLNGSNCGNPSPLECADHVPVPIQYCPFPDRPLPIPKASCSLWSDDSLFAP